MQSEPNLVSCPRNKHMFRRRSVGCFSRRSEPCWRLRRAYLESIGKERAMRKNRQLAPAQRVAMKMGRRLRCSSVTYPLRYAPSTASPARTALPAAHFDRNETYAYFGDRALIVGTRISYEASLRISRRVYSCSLGTSCFRNG